MSLLLDTHVVIWWRSEPLRLCAPARSAIEEADAVFVSAASIWEIEVKRAMGKVRLPERFSVGIAKSGFARLPITFEHAERAGSLPRHHGDPFDRMLVAQAQEEGLVLVTADEQLSLYDVKVLRAR